MGGARQNILVKFKQQHTMQSQFKGNQMLDTVNILHFSDSLHQDSLYLLKR